MENILLTTATLILLTIAVSCFANGEQDQGWLLLFVIYWCWAIGWIRKSGGKE